MNNHQRVSGRKKRVSSVVSAIAMLSMASGAFAEISNKAIELAIEQQELNSALMELAEKAGVEVIIPSGLSSSVDTAQLKGSYSIEEAFTRLLKGSGLNYQFISDGTVLIKKEENEEAGAEEAERDKEVDEEIIVLGSKLITDPTKLTRQTDVITREEIERSGATRLDEYLRRLPQNMNAPSNIGAGFNASVINDFGLGANVFAGSGVNLRGLGSQYTLVLIDGRRPAAGGQFGAITDISNIPVERVERVEILYDGAAAMYGSDAIGGVINIVTRKDYDGTDASLTLSDTADGGGKRYNFNIGHTISWESGSLTGSLSYQTQDAIDGSERNLALIADETFQLPVATPGVIGGLFDTVTVQRQALMWVRDNNGDGDTLDAGLDERIDGFVVVPGTFFGSTTVARVSREDPQLPSFFVPDDPTVIDQMRADLPQDNGYTAVRVAQLPEYTGEPISIYDVPDTNALPESTVGPRDSKALSPEDDTYTLSLNLQQQLAESLALGLNLNYTRVDKTSSNGSRASDLTLEANEGAVGPNENFSRTNPFNERLDYTWQNNLPQSFNDVDGRSYSLDGNLEWGAIEDWTVTLNFGVSQNNQKNRIINGLVQEDPNTGSHRDLLSIESLSNGRQRYFDRDAGEFVEQLFDVDFNDPLLGFASTEELIAAVINPFNTTVSDTTSRDIDLNFRGALAELSAGDITTNITLSHRRQTTEIFNDNEQYNREDLLSGTGAGFGAGPRTDVAFYRENSALTTNAVGAEFLVPLVGGETALPAMAALDFHLAGRYEDYSTTADNGSSWTAGLNWTVSDSVIVKLNRSHSVRVPNSILSARGLTMSSRAFYFVYQITPDGRPDFFGPGRLRIDEQIFRLSGGADHLVPETNDSMSLGFIVQPTFVNGLTLELNLVESKTEDQIRAPGIDTTITTAVMDNLGTNPLFFRASGDLVGTEWAQSSASRPPLIVQEGDLIVDQRQFNVGDTLNRSADMKLTYNFSTDRGDWFVTWRHQYLDTSEVVQSDICADGSCISNFRLSVEDFSTPLNTVDTLDQSKLYGRNLGAAALPRNSANLDIYWGYRGLGVTLNTNWRQATTSIFEDTALQFIDGEFVEPQNIRVVTTTPARSVNMQLSYDFSSGDLFQAPEWLSSTRIALTIDDVWRRDEKITQTYTQQEFTPSAEPFAQLNRYAIDPRGRAWSLDIRATF